MAMISTDLRCDLEKPVEDVFLKGCLFAGDNNANTFNVHVFENNAPVNLTGWDVVGTVIKANGGEVSPINGEISESNDAACLTLPSGAYAVPGKTKIIIKIEQGTTKITVASVIINVFQTATGTVINA